MFNTVHKKNKAEVTWLH